MSLRQSTYHSKLYREFKAIPPESQREVMRFYEENEKAVLELDFEEYFDLLVSYVDALFVIGKYRQHLLMVDIVIENTIQRNIFHYHGRDLFYEMLSCKGLSYLQVCEYRKAEGIFKQLIRINPEEEKTVNYLEKTLRVAGSSIQLWSRAFSIGLLLLVAIVIGFEILLIRPFYELQATYVEFLRTALFVSACAVIGAGEGLHWIICKRKSRAYWQRVRKEKA